MYENVDLTNYELPPKPPVGVFDIRYGSGRIAEEINNETSMIELSGVTYPLTVRVENVDIRLMDESGKLVNVNLNSGDEVVINNATIQKLMVTKESLPEMYSLEQNYPNPFNPSTKIKFNINEGSFISLVIYDILGNQVTTLVNEEKPAGSYEVTFNADNLPSGIYLARLTGGSKTSTIKVSLVK